MKKTATKPATGAKSKPAAKGSTSKPAAKGAGAAASKPAAAPPAAAAAPPPPPPVKVIPVKGIANLVLNDVDGEIKSSNKWPLVIDPGTQCTTFLKYRDVNMLDIFVQNDMFEETIRNAVLGSLRFGKELVVTLGETESLDRVIDSFNKVKDGLYSWIMDGSIKNEEKYKTLIRPTDPEEYQRPHEFDAHVERFRFVVLTQKEDISDATKSLFFTIKIDV